MRITHASLFAALLSLALPLHWARADTLWEALAMAYTSNPTLLAERASLRAIDEGVPQALSGWRPTVTVTGEGGKSKVNTETAFFTSEQTRTPRSIGLSLSQPLYRGGRTVAGTRLAESLVRAGREQLRATEQEVLLQAVIAYMDVLRDQAVVELTRNNERVLRRQSEATKDRFEVGELTRTDVAQSEARLSRAVSERVRAEGDLIAGRAAYKRVIGVSPMVLEPAPPLGDLPGSEEDALAAAEAENPNLLAARFDEQASRQAVRQSIGDLLPTLSLDGEFRRAEDASSRDSVTERASIAARVSVPIYQAGAVSSQVRQARQTLSQRRLEVDERRRAVTEAVTRAWEELQTARARITSNTDQVRANEIAHEGVREEASVGARTILDVLDAEQELLDARVSLVRVQRDEYVAAYRLRQAIGRLSARHLELKVEPYDPTVHYDAVHYKWIGFDEFGRWLGVRGE